MKAYVYRRYGGPEVLEPAELPIPAPKRGEIRVRVHATTVSSADWRMRSLTLPRGFGVLGRPVIGFLSPRQPILGTEFAGVVDAAGAGVTRFEPGDAKTVGLVALAGRREVYGLANAVNGPLDA